MRRHEAETRLNAAENNLKEQMNLKTARKAIGKFKKQAEEATKYRKFLRKLNLRKQRCII